MTILERLKTATGPDRGLDAEIVKTLCPSAIVQEYVSGDGEDSVFHAQSIGIANKSYVPEYTASIDAALALVEKMLPEHGVSLYIDPKKDGGKATCCFHTPGEGGDPTEFAESAHPALAVLVSIFTALEKEAGK